MNLSARGWLCGGGALLAALLLFIAPYTVGPGPDPAEPSTPEPSSVARPVLEVTAPPTLVVPVAEQTEAPLATEVTVQRIQLPYADEINEPGPPCAADELSTSPLTSFAFWGTTMNTTSTCPTSGMNNQMQMLMFYHWCRRRKDKPVLKWKDISCSPTGGVHQGGGIYAVGSRSYTYTWFRWSSLFNVSKGAICFSDKYTWSMHPWIRGCGLTDAAYRAFYGTEAYWKHRPAFDYRRSFYMEADRFLEKQGLITASGERVPFLAVHLRRGDYVKFCREVAKSYRKLRLAHWKWSKQNGASDLYDRHMDTCFPSRERVIAGIKRLCAQYRLQHVLMATTHPDFLPSSKEFAAAVAPAQLHWFDTSAYTMSKAAYTAIDSVLLGVASHKLLNRYSTLSLTAVDLTVINGLWNGSNVWFW